jgi:hypothetical protein
MNKCKSLVGRAFVANEQTGLKNKDLGAGLDRRGHYKTGKV